MQERFEVIGFADSLIFSDETTFNVSRKVNQHNVCIWETENPCVMEHVRDLLVQVYGREAMSRKCVYEWFKLFHEGKEMTEDAPCLGRPLTSRTPEMIEKM